MTTPVTNNIFTNQSYGIFSAIARNLKETPLIVKIATIGLSILGSVALAIAISVAYPTIPAILIVGGGSLGGSLLMYFVSDLVRAMRMFMKESGAF